MTAAPRVVVVGDVGVDVVVRPVRPMTAGQDTAARIVTTPGGAGANLAARLAGFGVDVTLFARVGRDEIAAAARTELTAAGVDCRFTVDEFRPTCTVVVLVGPDGERTMLSDRGAGAALAPADVDLDDVDLGDMVPDDVVPADLGPTDPDPPDPAAEPAGRSAAGAGRTAANGRIPHLHLSGYVLLDPRTRAAGRAALDAARARGWSTSLDPQSGTSGDDTVGPSAILAHCAGVDLLLPNQSELAALGGAAAVTQVFPSVALTRGAAGASLLRGAERLDLALPAEAGPITEIDTTGAGDAFNAGFLAAWLTGAAAAQALRSGMISGTIATSHPGGRPR